MSPITEASGRVHRPHVPWSLLSAEIFIQDISWPSLVVCCTREYWYWCCVSSIQGHAQAFWSRYVGVFLVSIHCLVVRTSSVVTAVSSSRAENCVSVLICSSMLFSHLWHVHVARLFKILPFVPLKFWWWHRGKGWHYCNFRFKAKIWDFIRKYSGSLPYAIYKANFTTTRALSSRSLLTI